MLKFEVICCPPKRDNVQLQMTATLDPRPSTLLSLVGNSAGVPVGDVHWIDWTSTSTDVSIHKRVPQNASSWNIVLICGTTISLELVIVVSETSRNKNV